MIDCNKKNTVQNYINKRKRAKHGYIKMKKEG
jgi:hypothetical protein